MRLKELLDKTTKSFLIKTQNMKLCVTVLCFSIILWCPLVWQSKKKKIKQGGVYQLSSHRAKEFQSIASKLHTEPFCIYVWLDVSIYFNLKETLLYALN